MLKADKRPRVGLAQLPAPIQQLLLTTLLMIFSAYTFADEFHDSKKAKVQIKAGDISLAATLYRPAGIEGNLPAIVTAHGSAPTTRDGVEFYTYYALKMGFAVLSFDKRGTGSSTGTYVPFSVETSDANFRKLASDVAYSVRWLSKQLDIDETRIGLFGGSQAGWIMPLAASKEPLVSFIIVGEGAPITTYEESIHGAISGDGDWDHIKAAQADLALINLHFQDGMPKESGFNPGASLQNINVPTLWIFGMRDAVIPVEASITRLEELIRNGKTNNAVHVYPFGDHNFRNLATGKKYKLDVVIKPWLQSIGIVEG
jgi:dipeptidyl aminopeptidase/acylaminoacyl peptidase